METAILTVGAFLAGFIVKSFLPGYFQEKGKNIATKQDIEDITRKIESVKAELARAAKIEESILKLKYEALGEAVGVIEQHLASIDWGGPDASKPEEKRPSQMAWNNAYSKLMMTVNDPDIVKKFSDINLAATPYDRGVFLHKVRAELGLPPLDVDPGKIPYMFNMDRVQNRKIGPAPRGEGGSFVPRG